MNWRLSTLITSLCLNCLVATAQLPGMAPPAAATVSQTVTTSAGGSTLSFWARHWNTYLGPDSPYRSVILTVVTILVLLNLKAYFTRLLKRKFKKNKVQDEHALSFMKVWGAIWKVIMTILVVIAMSGSLKLLGLTAGFLGMMLGWSLQQPVTGIAAWLMIILKRPFKTGDRVVIAGITGDVTGITMTHVILNQVGGSIGGEERSGRGILIPNAILFQHIIINYTLEQEFMLDEVPVRLTFDSDWNLAKQLMITAATEVTHDIIAKTGTQPFIRAEFLDWGILIRLRYDTIPARRQEISTDIIEVLLREFTKAYPKVRFAIPAQSIRYSPEARPDGHALATTAVNTVN